MQTDVIILISSKRDFKLKVTRRNTDDQFILIKGTVTQDIQSKPNYMYTKIWCIQFHKSAVLGLKTQINTNPLIVGDITMYFSSQAV